jgi:hypothetical protein
LPTITFPRPKDWPDKISASNNPIAHHEYICKTPIGSKTPQSVQASVQNDPTPNDNDRPATSAGTPNDATPSHGLRGTVASTRNNDVISYAGTDSNGNNWTLNVTTPAHTLSPGYVLRGTVGKDAVSYGEGLALKQALGVFSDVAINDAWIDQNQKNVDEAKP